MNKDGTPFSLRKPNPLLADQDSHDLILHNFFWDYIDEDEAKLPGNTIIKQEKQLKKEIIPEIKLNPVKIEQETFDAGLQITIETPKIPEVIPEPEIQIIPIKATLKEDKKLLKNTALVHCLPKTNTGYGKKFSFEAVIIKQADFGIVFWTPAKLELLSIVYPSVYVDGNIPFGDYQWWKVNGIEPKKQGYLTSAIVSELQPDFS